MSAVSTSSAMQAQHDRDARRQGLSDGYYGYPCNPGDWPPRQANAYRAAHAEGVVKKRGGQAW